MIAGASVLRGLGALGAVLLVLAFIVLGDTFSHKRRTRDFSFFTLLALETLTCSVPPTLVKATDLISPMI